MTVFEELKERGIIAQCTDEGAVRELLDDGKATFYIGFDPTADSLHVGHFMGMTVMARLQRAGHTPIALFGGGTGLIGDPSGKTDMRKMLTREEIDRNIECFVKQMSGILDFGEGKAVMANNADWLLNLNYIEFLREVGVHFSVNRMLAAECYKQRLERGLTFFEMNYMVMQSYDFLVLNRKYGCRLQLGGDDQWSNMIGGVELIRRSDGGDAYAMTFNLLLTSEGKKMGKTERGAVWLDPVKTPPYDFYQYWRNTSDRDVIKCLKMLTFVPLEEIAGYEGLTGEALNPVKERLAYELTAMIHGESAAASARDAARGLFSGAGGDSPETVLLPEDLPDGGITLAELLVKTGLAPSRAEARRLVAQGGVTVNGEKAGDPLETYGADALREGVSLKKGKKVFHRAVLKG